MMSHFKYIILVLVISSLSIAVHASAGKHSPVLRSLAGKTMVLQIENLENNSSVDYPSKGVIVQEYSSKRKRVGEVSVTNSGDIFEIPFLGQYRYAKTGKHSAVEYIVSDSGDTIKTQYTFSTRENGSWKRSINHDEIIASGSFFIQPVRPSNSELAPENHNGITVALSVLEARSEVLPSEAFPAPGSVILQSYSADASYTAQGFGPGTVAHFGTYSYERISHQVAVETTLQTIPSLEFTAPFTMVYRYETPYSGTWYQNFADGLIIFSGTFTAFATQ